MKIRTLSIAEEELADACEYYDSQSCGLGSEFITEFEAVVARIVQFPMAWRQVGARHRRCLFRRFPFAVLYSIRGEEIVIVGIMDLRRSPERQIRRTEGT